MENKNSEILTKLEPLMKLIVSIGLIPKETISLEESKNHYAIAEECWELAQSLTPSQDSIEKYISASMFTVYYMSENMPYENNYKVLNFQYYKSAATAYTVATSVYQDGSPELNLVTNTFGKIVITGLEGYTNMLADCEKQVRSIGFDPNAREALKAMNAIFELLLPFTNDEEYNNIIVEKLNYLNKNNKWWK